MQFTSEHERVRIEKIASLREKGIDPYPAKGFNRTNTVQEIREDFRDGWDIKIAGRLVALRRHGKTSFGNILDDGERIQIYFKKDLLCESYHLLSLLDIGDFIGLKGETFTTHTGEPTVLVQGFTVLAKSISPLPEKWHGLQDKEQRYRQRYIDLIVTPQTRVSLQRRTEIVKLIRRFLDEKGFLEVETPILQPIYGGAFAKPFKTDYKALNREFFLRISDELYLKRLICGGFDKVYEIGKDFRNEGIDRLHNPEFTQIELYEAYSDYMDMKRLTEEMLLWVVENLYNKKEIEYQGVRLNFAPPWETISYFDAIKKFAGVDLQNADIEYVKKVVEQAGIDADLSLDRDTLIDKIFGEKVVPRIEQPTFIIDYPSSISPLAKRHPDNPKLAQRFEPVIAGIEIGNAFSELNDPLEQERKFAEQMERKKKGDQEAHPLDQDFLKALAIGMPPTGGLGLGIDRIVMLLTDSRSIKDVIAFPQMR